MKTLRLLLFLVLSLRYNGALVANTLTLTTTQFEIDRQQRIILSNAQINDLLVVENGEPTITSVRLDADYQFVEPPTELDYGVAYLLTRANGEEIFTLYFTQLPIILINSLAEIVDEPRRPAYCELREAGRLTLQSTVGVEYRGGWTQSLPKKSLRLEFWTDTLGTENVDRQLLGMRTDDDWNLQAMFNEPLRARSKSNFQLWQRFNRLAYAEQEPTAQNGIDQAYVEAFINGSYQGVYLLSERIDRKQLQLQKYTDQQRGMLHYAFTWNQVSSFTGLPSLSAGQSTWGGVAIVYPRTNPDWQPFSELVDLVVNATPVDFNEQLIQHLDIPNATDYFILLNLLRATDNTRKNVFYARYDAGQPFFIIPWDLDGTFGIIWNGERRTTYDDVLHNPLLQRLIEDCRPVGTGAQLRQRWNELRTTHLTAEQIEQHFFANVDWLQTNGVYEREAQIWSDYQVNIAEERAYFSSWLANRLQFLDAYFARLCDSTSTANETSDGEVSIYPNPTTQVVNIKNLPVATTLQLFDAYGRLQLTRTPVTGNQLDLGQLAKGIYYLQLETADGVVVRKIIKQ